MICKECGAYNNDAAKFCKVCGVPVSEVEGTDVVEEIPFGKPAAPAWNPPARPTRQEPSYNAAPYDAAPYSAAPNSVQEEEPAREAVPENFAAGNTRRFTRPAPVEPQVEAEDDDIPAELPPQPVKRAAREESSTVTRRNARSAPIANDDEDDDEEEEKPLRQRPAQRRFTRPAAPLPVEDEDDEDDEEDEEPVVPVKRRSARPAVVPVESDDDDDDEADEPYHDEDDLDDSDIYEPTPPRKRQSGKSEGGNLTVILITIAAVVVLLIVAVILFFNFNEAQRSKLPSWLQLSCIGGENKEPDATNTDEPTDAPDSTGEAPVVNPSQDNEVTLEEFISDSGNESVRLIVYVEPGETVSIVLGDGSVNENTNNENAGKFFRLEIAKAYFYPNRPLTNAEYVVTPEMFITNTSGQREDLVVPSFTLYFSPITLSVTSPESLEGAIMADSANQISIVGTVDDHNVDVFVNDVEVTVYEGGNFQTTYTMNGDADQTVTIRAERNNWVSSSVEFTATKYVYIPKTMEFTVTDGVAALRADAKRKVTVNGLVTAGAQLSLASSNADVIFGSVSYGDDGTYSFDCTFGEDAYGISLITMTATREGYEEATLSCLVTRSYEDRKEFVKEEDKKGGYFEIPSDITYEELVADSNKAGGIRVRGQVVEVITLGNYVVVKFKLNGSDKVVYIMNQSTKWEPAANIGNKYRVYCTTYGLYTDTGAPYLIGWFAMND